MNLLVGTNALFLVVLVIYVVIRRHFMTRLEFAETEVNAIDPIDRILVFFVALTVILFPVAFLVNPLCSFADYAVPLDPYLFIDFGADYHEDSDRDDLMW